MQQLSDSTKTRVSDSSYNMKINFKSRGFILDPEAPKRHRNFIYSFIQHFSSCFIFLYNHTKYFFGLDIWYPAHSASSGSFLKESSPLKIFLIKPHTRQMFGTSSISSLCLENLFCDDSSMRWENAGWYALLTVEIQSYLSDFLRKLL